MSKKTVISITITDKKIALCFLAAFLTVLAALITNQILLLRRVVELSSFRRILLFTLYSLPAALTMAVPYAVCTGLIQGIIAANRHKRIFTIPPGKENRKHFIKLLCFGLALSVLGFIIIDFFLPGANSSFAGLYNSIRAIESSEKGPREMTAREIAGEIGKIRENAPEDAAGRLNLYRLELGKKFAVPLGALFFTLFALSLSPLLRKQLPGLGIGILVCCLHWFIIMYGQVFSLRIGRFGALSMWLPNILLLSASLLLCLYGYRKGFSLKGRLTDEKNSLQRQGVSAAGRVRPGGADKK
jgi:lipopolysaccharide export LptBFGC system permease protein LptF